MVNALTSNSQETAGHISYYDYKGNNSVILLAAVGPQYEILWADVGTNGRASDGTVWHKSHLKQALTDQQRTP